MPGAIHHLDCGTMCPRAGKLVGGASWLAPGTLVCHVLVIETARDGLVLVDTGFGTRDVADPTRVPAAFRALTRPVLDPAQCAAAQLPRLGYAVEDVRHVVVTHLDLDHAGGLGDFPAATVHVHRDEHAAALHPGTLAERARYLQRLWGHAPRWATYAPRDGERWQGLPAVRELDGVADEILLVPLPGHSRGHSGVAVRRSAGWLLHAGDAIFSAAELRPGTRVPLGLRAIARVDQHDGRARQASVRALQRLPVDVTVVCSHDPAHLPASR